MYNVRYDVTFKGHGCINKNFNQKLNHFLFRINLFCVAKETRGKQTNGEVAV